MSEDRNNEVPLSNGTAEDDKRERSVQPLKTDVNEISSEKIEEASVTGLVSQQLVCKFQQLHKNENRSQDFIRQLMLLCSELIDNVGKSTSDNVRDILSCLQLLERILSLSPYRTFVENDKLFAREIFFILLDVFAKPSICQYLNDDQHMLTMHKRIYKCLMDLLLHAAAMTATFVPFTNDDLVVRRYTETFIAMHQRVKRDLQLRSRTKESTDDDIQTAHFILSFFCNLSDRTVIVQWLLDIDLVKSMLECLKMTQLSSEIILCIVTIIHNISRHDDGADEIKKLDGLQIVKDYQNSNGVELNDETNLVMSMAIALLSTSEQIRSDNKRMNRMLNQLLQITIGATKAKDYRSHEGFHVSEPLAVFTKLFVDDHSLEYVLSHAETDPPLTVSSTIALFVQLLIEFRNAYADKKQLEQFTCTALLNILWSISFQDRYKIKLQQNKDFIMTIKSLAIDDGETIVDQYVPRSMESMSKAANGILYNLNEIGDTKVASNTDTQLVSNASCGKPMIMISYAHDNNRFCDKILAEFEKHRNLFEIWIDRDHCSSSEDLWEKIARGIGQSRLVVCLLSQDYFNSKSCRKEAAFAVQRKKFIVPVYIGEPGDCDWLDIHIAGLKYVRFKGDGTQLDSSKVQELLKTIQATVKEAQSQPIQQQTEQHNIPAQPRKETEIIKSTAFDVKKPPEEWTTDDIHMWFSSHHVPDTLVRLFDFQSTAEMHEYAVKLHTDPKKEFVKYEQRYTKAYAGDELEEYIFNRFKNALLTLPAHPLGISKTPASSAQISTSKSSACTIS